MVEEIKEKLFYCSLGPNCKPYACLKASFLAEALQEIKQLPFEAFTEVFKYAIKLNLPQDFKDELRFEAINRGYKNV